MLKFADYIVILSEEKKDLENVAKLNNFLQDKFVLKNRGKLKS